MSSDGPRVERDHGAAAGVPGEAAVSGNHTRAEAQPVRPDYLHDEAMLGPGAREQAAVLRCRYGAPRRSSGGKIRNNLLAKALTFQFNV